MPEWVLILCGYFVTATTAIIGWVKFLFERRDKREALTRQAAADRDALQSREELKEIKRRSFLTFPFFQVSKSTAHSFLVETASGIDKGFISNRTDVVLSVTRQFAPEMIADGQMIYLLIENIGSTGYIERVTLDGYDTEFLVLKRGIEPSRERFLSYRFCFVRRGKVQLLKITIVSPEGVRDTHTYETKHGERYLKRIDPV